MGKPIFVSLLSWVFTFYTVLGRNKKLEELPNLEIFVWSVLGVLTGKSEPLGRAQSADHIQGFMIPDN